MDSPEYDPYPCIGICTTDPETGCCLGCGRPPLPAPEASVPPLPAPPAAGQDETPA
ncbi:MAG: DUF1289 domain-containing protein [Azonexus sp.]|jgi:hypothetical protein|nr:DUF1289 domain-containing protein [Azonexus sp.]